MTPPPVTPLDLEIAHALLQQCGKDDAVSLEPLSGGRNNRTFRVRGTRGTWLLKHYFHDQNQGWNRAEREWEWATFCWQCGVRWGPEPLAFDRSLHATLSEFLDGRKLNASELTERHVEQSASFVADINEHRNSPPATKIRDAAEACFSLKEHLDCVERRISRLAAVPVNDDLSQSLSDWRERELEPRWKQLVSRVKGRVTQTELEEFLPRSSRCLSPSDFGFHNALLTENDRLRFFDFEYAGWDDPAKLVCDYFLQPEVPVPLQYQSQLLHVFSDRKLWGEVERRVELLFPVFGIKWCCLLLNEFLAQDRRRREFSQTAPITESRKAEQFARARQRLASLEEFQS
ncbi:phosphotransferase [Schlesneria sp. T3-172]|uniref:phosphotransferase n=1 Tax=Schlesneria sphaerica TaxID=3373610 RepID=UPI0037CA6233